MFFQFLIGSKVTKSQNLLETSQMDTVERKEDTRPLDIEMKSMKSEKNKGEGRLEADSDLPKENKIKSVLIEDGDVALHKKDNMGGTHDLHKKDKKKRKRDSPEKAQINKKEQGPVDGLDHDPESRKEKKVKHDVQEREHETDRVISAVEVSKVEKVVCDEVVDGKSSNEDVNEMINFTPDSNNKNTQSGMEKGDSEEAKAKGKSKKVSEGSKGKKKGKIESFDNNSEKAKAKGKSKKVSFSGHVDVFPSSNTDNKKQIIQEDNLVRGKRFTPEEDEIVKEAVLNYIKQHDLGGEGLTKVMNCQSYPELKNCWREIGTCIPYRPHTATYYRAHILFERAEKRAWTPEETEFLRKFYEKHGNNWKIAAEELGKHRIHVKDKWRRIGPENIKKGRWSQEEYQSLYELVNLDLLMKVGSDKKSKHGMLRDNIPWTTISEKLSTRNNASCCEKWYHQLSSSLVKENKWSNADDYRLISALYDLDAACLEDVDWDALLEHRSGDVCRKRWDQMVLHIGHHGSKPFSEQVETLATRYCPELAETREAWDNKPFVQ